MIFNDSKTGIQELVKSLNASEPVVMPTETVYGLAAKIDDLEGLKKIFLYKKRPFFDPLIVHIYNKKQITELSQFESSLITTLTDTFWPGPLTIILPKRESVSELITSGLDSVGIRMPKHPLAIELLKSIGTPLAAPSANIFGQTSPTQAAHVESDFPNLKILDGGPCEIGIESTVLKIQPLENSRMAFSILRKGIITQSQIQASLKGHEEHFEWSIAADTKQSPGHMKHHYMPKTPIVFFDQPISINDWLPAIQNDFANVPGAIENVSISKPTGPIQHFIKLHFSADPLVACRELYGKLKAVSQSEAQILVFELQPHMTGEIWEAFIERISKAASLRYKSQTIS